MVARMARSVAAIGRWVSLAQTLEPRLAAWSGAKVDRELLDVFLSRITQPHETEWRARRGAARRDGGLAST